MATLLQVSLLKSISQFAQIGSYGVPPGIPPGGGPILRSPFSEWRLSFSIPGGILVFPGGGPSWFLCRWGYSEWRKPLNRKWIWCRFYRSGGCGTGHPLHGRRLQSAQGRRTELLPPAANLWKFKQGTCGRGIFCSIKIFRHHEMPTVFKWNPVAALVYLSGIEAPFYGTVCIWLLKRVFGAIFPWTGKTDIPVIHT